MVSVASAPSPEFGPVIQPQFNRLALGCVEGNEDFEALLRADQLQPLERGQLGDTVKVSWRPAPKSIIALVIRSVPKSGSRSIRETTRSGSASKK